jgi:hypothetical protein
MYLSPLDFDLSKETLALVGRDLDWTCSDVLDHAERLHRSMLSKGETKRSGNRYNIEYLVLPAEKGREREFSNVLRFRGHGPEIPRVDLDVAWGVDSCGREVVAWAEWQEKGKIPALVEVFPAYSGAAFNVCSPDHMPRSALAAVRTSDSWGLLSPAYMISLRKGLLRFILEWEAPDV